MTVRDATPRLPVSLRSRPSACGRFLRPHTWCHDVYRVHEPVWGRSSREDGMPRPPSACACPGMVEHFDSLTSGNAIQFDPSNAFRSSSDATIGSHPIWIPMGIVRPRLQFVALQCQTFTIRLRGIKSALGATKTRKSARALWKFPHAPPTSSTRERRIQRKRATNPSGFFVHPNRTPPPNLATKDHFHASNNTENRCRPPPRLAPGRWLSSARASPASARPT